MEADVGPGPPGSCYPSLLYSLAGNTDLLWPWFQLNVPHTMTLWGCFKVLTVYLESYLEAYVLV